MKRFLTATLVATVVATGGPVLAHHSYSKYLTEETVSIEGTLESYVYANPHSVLKIRRNDSRVYTAEWRSSNQLGHDGVTHDTLKPGDHIVVSGSPARDAGVAELSLLREVRRPSDGWRWGRKQG